ncbi:MAG: hypothetical protein AAF317_21370, partial [Pseudomonadota bacterium]
MSDLGLTCLIALEDWDDLDPDLLVSAIQRLSPRSSATAYRVVADPGEDALMVSVDGHDFAVAVMTGQIPEPDLSDAMTQSVFWRDAASEIARHRAFSVLSAVERQVSLGLTRAQAIALTSLAAGVAECLPSLGLYWRGAEGLVPPSRLLSAQREIAQNYWPVDIWIGYSFYRKGDGNEQLIGVQSRGALDYLGFEVEVPPLRIIDDDWKEPLRILFTTLAHLIALGQKIR